MAALEFRFIGWCHNKDSKGEHDKIWASFELNDSYYACWGARGKTVNFKRHTCCYDLDEVQRSKEKKYDRVGEAELLKIWPDFYQSVEMRLVFCVMANHIK